MEPEAEIIRAQLFALQDETYRTFHSALMPTVPLLFCFIGPTYRTGH